MRHRISKLPRVLILHLKRFDSAAGVKRLTSCGPPNALAPPVLQGRRPTTASNDAPTAAAFEIAAPSGTKARPSSLAVVDGGAVPPAGGAVAAAPDASDASDASGLGRVVACHGSGGSLALERRSRQGLAEQAPRRNLFGSRGGEAAGGGAQSGGRVAERVAEREAERVAERVAEGGRRG